MLLSRLSFPGPAQDQAAAVIRFATCPSCRRDRSSTTWRPANRLRWSSERGVRLLVELEAIGEPDHGGMRTVIMKLNGQVRPVDARDRSVEPDVAVSQKADPGTLGMSPLH